MVKAVDGWIHVEQDTPVNFTVVVETHMIAKAACDCADRYYRETGIQPYFDPACRPCTINKALYDSAAHIEIINDEENRRRILRGRAETDAQKIACTRLFAIIRGDPEPLDIAEARLLGVIH